MKITRVIESDAEGAVRELAIHQGWRDVWPRLEEAIHDMRDAAILAEERHLYHKGYYQGAQYLLSFLEGLLKSYKD